MNLYVHTINNVIEYIEQSIAERLTLQSVSEHFFLSEFHFSRLFKMITGKSLKQYILGRKLAVAVEKLNNPLNTITDIAYDLGFEYPEVFSRDFKKWFGISPAVYRNGHSEISPMPKAFLVDRDVMYYQGALALKETYIYLEEQTIYGVSLEVDENSSDFNYLLQSTGESFLTDSRYDGVLKDNYLYTVVNCYGDDSGKYSVFWGAELASSDKDCNLKTRHIPSGWYARFNYYGDMLDMRKTFDNDFYKWMVLKEIEPSPNGIGMLNIFDRMDMQDVRIYVPIKQPK